MTKAKYIKIKVQFTVKDFSENLYKALQNINANLDETYFSNQYTLNYLFSKIKNINAIDNESNNELFEITLKVKL